MNILRRLFGKEPYFMKPLMTDNMDENLRLFTEHYNTLKIKDNNAINVMMYKTIKELNRYHITKLPPSTKLYFCRLLTVFYTFCMDNHRELKLRPYLYDYVRLQTLVYKNQLAIYSSAITNTSDTSSALVREAYVVMNTFFWAKAVKY